MIPLVTLFESYPGLLFCFLRRRMEVHSLCKAALASRHSRLPQSCSTKEKADFSKPILEHFVHCCHKYSQFYLLIKCKAKSQTITWHVYFLTFFCLLASMGTFAWTRLFQYLKHIVLSQSHLMFYGPPDIHRPHAEQRSFSVL